MVQGFFEKASCENAGVKATVSIAGGFMTNHQLEELRQLIRNHCPDLTAVENNSVESHLIQLKFSSEDSADEFRDLIDSLEPAGLIEDPENQVTLSKEFVRDNLVKYLQKEPLGQAELIAKYGEPFFAQAEKSDVKDQPDLDHGDQRLQI